MPNTSVGTLKAQIGNLNRECARLRAEISKIEEEHSEFVNEILKGAPECMDGDASGESIALDYVRSLEGQGSGMSGHRDDCTCWE
jgi:hypothetical protein